MTEKGPRYYLGRIREIRPEIEFKSVEFNNDGLVNDVVMINGKLIFRFAKDEAGVRALDAELRVLNAVRQRTRLPVPEPFYTAVDMIAYPFLPGESLTRAALAGLAESDRKAVAEQLAGFLYDLHHTPLDENLPRTAAPVRRSDWDAIYAQVKEHVYPLLMKHQREWAEDVFTRMFADEAGFDYTPCLIHGDLGCYHILFDPGSRRLSGVIDFGVAGVGDPANDLACLIQYYGESFVRRFAPVYPLDERLMNRARFYARGLELQWLLNGLRSGEPFWFAAHIGGARDEEEYTR